MCKKCANCKKEIPPKPHAYNVKYCKDCRQEAYKYPEYRTQWQRNKTGEFKKGKIQCRLCEKWYYKPMCHAYQTHNITEKEYKEHFGLERKGILADSTKEKLQEAVRDNYDVVIKKNLIERGEETRYKTGDPNIGKYQRSEETLKRLRQHIKNISK